ncbi:MAG TPA: ABC transporter ATP-binding protein [Candidatus Binatia bacterium]|nr:ABC transporter ATP-binding protein [Candidatus Binatia bacterium]
MNEAPVVKVECVSKKFCRNLNYSLWYGLRDIGREIAAQNGTREFQLRPYEFLAIDDVSLELKQGECLGLIGRNGAGKSTLLKLLNGLVRPDSGRITIRGRVGALIELGTGFNPILTGRENVYVNGAILGLSKREIDTRFDEIVAFADLADFIDAPLQSYSAGMRVRLGFAVAAHIEPNLLLVDEVLAVGDVAFRMKCFQRILTLKQEGTAILLVTHQMPDVSRVCTRAVLLEQGRITANDNVPACIAAYDRLLLTRVGNPSENGDGPVRVKSVAVLNGDGVPCQSFRTEGEMSIDLRIECYAPVPDGRIRVYVESARYGLLAGFSTAAAGIAVDFTPPASQLRLRLPKIPFKVGGYSIGVGLFGAGPTGLLFNQPGLAGFEVTEPSIEPFGYSNDGIVEVEHRWERG